MNEMSNLVQRKGILWRREGIAAHFQIPLLQPGKVAERT